MISKEGSIKELADEVRGMKDLPDNTIAEAMHVHACGHVLGLLFSQMPSEVRKSILLGLYDLDERLDRKEAPPEENPS